MLPVVAGRVDGAQLVPVEVPDLPRVLLALGVGRLGVEPRVLGVVDSGPAVGGVLPALPADRLQRLGDRALLALGLVGAAARGLGAAAGLRPEEGAEAGYAGEGEDAAFEHGHFGSAWVCRCL